MLNAYRQRMGTLTDTARRFRRFAVGAAVTAVTAVVCLAAAARDGGWQQSFKAPPGVRLGSVAWIPAAQRLAVDALESLGVAPVRPPRPNRSAQYG